MLRSYKFLNSRENRDIVDNDQNSVDGDFQPSDFRQKLLVRDEFNNMYYVFAGRSDFIKWQETVENKCFHEIINGSLPQRIKFDIDADDEKLNNITAEGNNNLEKIRTIVSYLIDIILVELKSWYASIDDIQPTKNDLCVTTSNGYSKKSGKMKYSYHIIVSSYYLLNVGEVSLFVENLWTKLNPEYMSLVDKGIYKTNQGFRLFGSSKPGENRYKVDAPEFGCAKSTFSNTFITAPSGVAIMEQLCENIEAVEENVVIDNELVQKAVDIVKKHGTRNHTFSRVEGSFLVFKRDSPSFCALCSRRHEVDNTFYVIMYKRDSLQLYEKCRRSKESIYIDSIELSNSSVVSKNYSLEKHIQRIKSGEYDVVSHNKFESLPNALIYEESSLRPFELRETLVVRANMKMGKTKAMRSYIDTFFPKEKVIRILSFRQAFTQNLSHSFKEFSLYNEIVQEKITSVNHPKLIIQIESLHRLSDVEDCVKADLLVLDEFESILEQFNSGLHKQFNISFATFEWLLKFSKHVICMDANISNRSYNVLNMMRNNYPIYYHLNTFSRDTEDKYYFTTNQGNWLSVLYKKLEENNKIVIPVNSLTEAKALGENIKKQFPKKNLQIYSSEMSNSEKNKHFQSVSQYWSLLDVLIYTPTCSAGVSFEIQHFDILFAYFCDKSCDVETCRQMMGRVRNIKSKNHYICIQATGNSYPTEPDKIRQIIFNKKFDLYKTVNTDQISFSYDSDGNIIFHDSLYFRLWLESMSLKFKSMNSFGYRMVDQIAETKAQIFCLDETQEMENAALLLMDHRAMKSDIKYQYHANISNANDLNAEEARRIQECMRSNIDISVDDKYSFTKFKLGEFYNLQPKHLTTEFVESYIDDKVKIIYNNLKTLHAGLNVKESITKCKEYESKKLLYNADCRMNEYNATTEAAELCRDNSMYTYRKHELANNILEAFGINVAMRDTRMVPGTLLNGLRDIIPAIGSDAYSITMDLGISIKVSSFVKEPDDIKYMKYALMTINKILSEIYGMKISLTKKSGYYYLDRSIYSRFSFNKSREDLPDIQSNLVEIQNDRSMDLIIDDTYYSGIVDD